MLNQSSSKRRKGFELLMKGLMLLSVALTAALVLFLPQKAVSQQQLY